LLVLLPAVVFKFYIWMGTSPIVLERTASYTQSAMEIIEHGTYSGIETYRRTPGYPFFLAGTLRVAEGSMRAVTFAQHLLGLAIAAMIMRIAFLLWESRVAASLAGLLISFHPSFMYYESAIESEILAIFLFSIMLLLLIEGLIPKRFISRRMFAAGLAGGAAALTRPELSACIIVPTVFLLWKTRAIKPAVYFFLPFAALLSFWMLRNLALFNHFQLSPWGAVTSLQTSGPFIDWDSPKHAGFKKIYREILEEKKGNHLGVVNLTISRMMSRQYSFKEVMIDAAELGSETAFKHPFRYLWATRINFWNFLASILVKPGDVSDPAPSTPFPLDFFVKSLFLLSALGLITGVVSASGEGFLLISLCAFCIMTANCIADVGVNRRSFEVLPMLALFSSYFYVFVSSSVKRMLKR